MMEMPGPLRIASAMPRHQPMPLRSPTLPRRNSGSSRTPAQTQRWKVMSAGENPTSIPCRAVVKPTAQKIAAPAPQRMPMVLVLNVALAMRRRRPPSVSCPSNAGIQ